MRYETLTSDIRILIRDIPEEYLWLLPQIKKEIKKIKKDLQKSRNIPKELIFDGIGDFFLFRKGGWWRRGILRKVKFFSD